MCRGFGSSHCWEEKGKRIIATQNSFSSSLYSHLMEGFPLSYVCGLIARRAADVAPSKKFCLACHLGSSEYLCRDYCFAPVSSTFLFPLSAISAKLLTLLIGTGMQSDVLFCRNCLSWYSNLCRRWELLPLPDPDGAAARVSCKHSQRDHTRPLMGYGDEPTKNNSKRSLPFLFPRDDRRYLGQEQYQGCFSRLVA